MLSKPCMKKLDNTDLSFTLAHLSDAHLAPVPVPPLAYLLGKRATGYANWHILRRRKRHSMAVLRLVVADMRAQQPDHIAMTGDLVNIGLPSEFITARKFIDSLGAPEHVSVTPGNHDAYVKNAMAHLWRHFAPFMQGDEKLATQALSQQAVDFPFVRVRKGIALIGLCSGVPTPFFSARGALGNAQLTRLAAVLQQTYAQGLARIVMVHHAPHEGGARAMRGLIDAAEFEACLASHGAELVLHGHNHRASLAYRVWQRHDGTTQDVPILGVPSCSALSDMSGKNAGYHLIKVTQTNNEPQAGKRMIHIDVFLRGLAGGNIKTLATHQFAYEFAKTNPIAP